jgi:hypothetical protein
MRFDGPIQMTERIALDDVQVGDAAIPKGRSPSCAWPLPTGTPTCSTTPTSWTSNEIRTRTWASAEALTSASEPPWPGWKPA